MDMCFTGVCVYVRECVIDLACECVIDLACSVGARGCWLMLEGDDDRYNRLCGR